MIPDNPFCRHSGQPSIQLSPKGGKSGLLIFRKRERIEVRGYRNPAMKNMPRSGKPQGVVPLTWEFVNQLDSGLRRNDVINLMVYLR